MTVKIEKNVPLPKGRGRPGHYPWHTMKVGDSFLIKEPNFMIGNANVRYAPKRFASQKEKRGTRVWRIK